MAQHYNAETLINIMYNKVDFDFKVSFCKYKIPFYGELQK